MKVKKLKIIALVVSLFFCIFGVNEVSAIEEQQEFNSVQFNLKNMNVGDSIRVYQSEEEYIEIELIAFEPSKSSRAVTGNSGWSGNMPDGTYTLRPKKVSGSYNYSFDMTIVVSGLSTKIERVFSPVTDCFLALNQTRTLSIITKQSQPNLEALAEMSWEQTNNVDGTAVGTYSCYLGCMIRYSYNDYKVYWRI